MYDATKYLDAHPGGKSSIVIASGGDASDDFEALHSSKAWKLLEVSPNPNPNPNPDPSPHSNPKAHLRYAHGCESEEISFVNERLHGYVMRGGDGLVHRYVGSQLEGRVAPTEGHVRRYWLPTPTPTPASTPNSRLKPYVYP